MPQLSDGKRCRSCIYDQVMNTIPHPSTSLPEPGRPPVTKPVPKPPPEPSPDPPPTNPVPPPTPAATRKERSWSESSTRETTASIHGDLIPRRAGDAISARSRHARRRSGMNAPFSSSSDEDENRYAGRRPEVQYVNPIGRHSRVESSWPLTPRCRRHRRRRRRPARVHGDANPAISAVRAARRRLRTSCVRHFARTRSARSWSGARVISRSKPSTPASRASSDVMS